MNTLVNPKWRLCSGRRTVDGVLFKSYANGILRYTAVSEDGRIRVDSSNHGTTYNVEVLGQGWIKSQNNGERVKAFRFFETAARAGIKLLEKK